MQALKSSGNHKLRKHIVTFFIGACALLCSNVSLIAGNDVVDYRFKQIGTDSGLPSIEVLKITQQKNGYIWIGTDTGAARYDGVDYKHYFYSPGKDTHLSSNFVNDILEDDQGNIWIGTEDGLNKVTPDGKTHILKHDANDPTSIPESWITTLYLDSQGIMWVGTGYGLFSFDPLTNKASAYSEAMPKSSASATSVFNFIELDSGEIIAGSTVGVGIVNKATKTLEPYYLKGTTELLHDKYVTALLLDSKQRLYASSSSEGLIQYDPKTGIKNHYRAGQSSNSLKNDSIATMMLDGDTLWIGYTNYGLTTLNIETGDMQHITSREFEPFALPSDAIRNLFKDSSNTIWIATADGIGIYSPLTTGTHVYYKKPNKSEFSSSSIYRVFEDTSSGLIWVPSGEGLMLLDPKTKKAVAYPIIDERGKRFESQAVWQLDSYDDETLFLATDSDLLLFNKATKQSVNLTAKLNFTSKSIYTVLASTPTKLWFTGYLDVGLIHFDVSNGEFKHYLMEEGSYYADGGNFTTAMIQAQDGALMLATTDGVFRITEDGSTKHYPLSKLRDFIRSTSIVEQSSGIFWVATKGVGLVKMTLSDTLESTTEVFNNDNGFPSNEIVSVAIDGDFLWFNTKDELFRLSFVDNSLKAFPNLFSIPGLTFTDNGIVVVNDTLYLASSRGLITVEKSLIVDNDFNAPVKITNITSGDQSIAPESINRSEDDIKLDYKDNDITFRFAALDYSTPSGTKYSFKLEGADSEWSLPSSKRSTSYNNLDVGEYTFLVKGTNSSGVWSDEIAEIKFSVLRPWWSYLIIGLSLFLALSLVLYFVDRRKQLRFMRQKAHTDNLTGIANRYSFNLQLEKMLTSDSKSFGLAIIDMDGFKDVNDTFGHQIGDTYLIEVTRRIKKCIRSKDFLARLGGDEFAVIMTEYSDLEDVIKIADRIRFELHTDYQIAEQELSGSTSIGVSVYPQDGADSETLQINADTAMYEAKHSGKNRVIFFNESLHQSLGEKLRIRANLKKAIKQEQFQLYYQPKINQFTKQIVGAEALIRWIHPEDGFIPPDTFIPEAETNGTIIEIGDWVLINACRQAKAWQEEHDIHFKMSINVSAVQITQPNFIKNVTKTIKRTKVDPRLIELEITESVLIESRKQCNEIIRELKALGFTIALDDFGVGFSSLSYLTQFNLDTLKIDRSFVKDLKKDSQNLLVLKNIYNLAQDLQMLVVAEGVEDKKQLDLIAKLNGAIIQGYYYSPPVPADTFEALLIQEEMIPAKSY